MKKRQQHHVWKSYLRAWAKDEKIFCLQGGRIFESNISGVAVERDFYKLPTLNKKDVEYINLLIGNSPNPLTRLYKDFLMLFSIFGLLKDNLPPHMANDPEFESLIDQQIINIEEDFHSSIESNMSPIMAAIRQRDISFYNDDEQCIKFLHFLSLQLFRTKGVRERVIKKSYPADFNIDNCWNILRNIHAMDVGDNLFLDRKKRPLFLIENNTGVPFITGDQPVINLFSSPQPTEALTMLALYYPITPWLAIILDEAEERCGYGTGVISIDQVFKLNREMHAASFAQVFAHSREVLTSLCS
ncbi:MAG: DUF4238 domain-containing protein [Nitrospirae bacterium]|nr:DUF4238 domain-containing protein [Nitrospirota bacterium]MCL5284264.1 DUF4238 domain-containing protein [Nitrospirota bacterium]